jgi:hypothetical protein
MVLTDSRVLTAIRFRALGFVCSTKSLGCSDSERVAGRHGAGGGGGLRLRGPGILITTIIVIFVIITVLFVIIIIIIITTITTTIIINHSVTDSQGVTALMEAAGCGCEDLVSWLIDKAGADPEAADAEGRYGVGEGVVYHRFSRLLFIIIIIIINEFMHDARSWCPGLSTRPGPTPRRPTRREGIDRGDP